MQEVSINKSMKLSQHFTLGELCKTKHVTEDGNIPSHVAIENLKRICEKWLEDLRYSYNRLYVWDDFSRNEKGGTRKENFLEADLEEPIIISSGYRSPEVNRLAGGAKTSNHLSGCAVDIRCAGKEQMIRYAAILLDIADGTKQEFDELLLEQHGSVCWLHFAVRPQDNRRRIELLKI